MARRHRDLHVFSGEPAATAGQAAALLAALDPDEVFWVSPEPRPPFRHERPATLGRRLGQACDALVLDLHQGLDADVLGQAQGFVRGGGCLVVRLPPAAVLPPAHALAAWPHPPEAVGQRLWLRARARFEAAAVPPAPLAPPPHAAAGTADQDAAVNVLSAAWSGTTPSCTVLLADRGRGKSAALGLALARAARGRAVVSAGDAGQVREIFRFMGEAQVVFCPIAELAEEPCELLVVDEAARVPLPTLQRLVLSHPLAHLAFATTTRGYEGTGRGFVLRFLDWLAEQGRPPVVHHLRAPIRWGEGDPLEALVFDLLALDAEPSALSPRTDQAATPATVTHAVLDRLALAADEPLLRAVFGLLVHAHYRTTPGDLHRLLDAPNLSVHVLRHEEAVVAATLVAREGGLPPAICAAMARGELRLRAHALADTLVTHAGRPEAGRLRMIRSMRIAVHPALRRRGLGGHLVREVHATHAPDLFGTVFGATPDLLSFRRGLGYHLVRVGGSRGERTGAPGAVMVHPVSAEARALVDDLRAVLARNLPVQLALMAADGEIGLDDALASALARDLPPPSPWAPESLEAELAGYLRGPRTPEAVAAALASWVPAHLHHLPPAQAAFVRARILERQPWRRVAQGHGSVPAAQRELRRILRSLDDILRSTEP